VANPTQYQSFGPAEQLSRSLRRNAALAYLSFNMVTMLKQLPSFLLYMPDAGPGALLQAAAQFASNPKEAIEFVRERDPEMEFRQLERELEEMKIKDPTRYGRMVQKLGELGTWGIRKMDQLAVTIGWLAVYNKTLDVDKSNEADAIRQAHNVTLRTQPAAAAKDLAQIYASGEVLRWFTMFTNQINQIYNILTYDAPQAIKQGRVGWAMMSVMSVALSQLFIWSLTKRRLPRKPEDWKDALMETTWNLLPIVGREINSIRKGWHSNNIPPLQAIQAAYEIFKPGYDFSRRFEKALEFSGVLFGYPYIGIKRVGRAIGRGDISELIGGGPVK
jgi:hypothetical protein